MSFESVACCDDCWWDDWTNPEANGRGFMASEDDPDLFAVRFPTRMKNEVRELERCHFCGFTSYSGIYVRTNVTETPAASPREREVLGS